MESAKDDAVAAFNSARDDVNAQQTKSDEEEGKIQALQDTYDEKKRESEEARDHALVEDTANLLWGREAIEAREATATEPAVEA